MQANGRDVVPVVGSLLPGHAKLENENHHLSGHGSQGVKPLNRGAGVEVQLHLQAAQVQLMKGVWCMVLSKDQGLHLYPLTMVVGLIDQERRLMHVGLLLHDLLSYTLVESIQLFPSHDQVICARRSDEGSPSDESDDLNSKP